MNLFQLPAQLPQQAELHETLLQQEGYGLLIERIISTGQASPPGFWYDQAQNEWVLLLQGSAVLEWDNGRSMTLQHGDWLFIPAHARHRVAWTSKEPPCIWLAIHFER
ncbi:MAG TPA: cupin [Firmicutes bacterium]|nr:cupin [Bacillota bacterium]